jgi:hypothetical protein
LCCLKNYFIHCWYLKYIIIFCYFEACIFMSCFINRLLWIYLISYCNLLLISFLDCNYLVILASYLISMNLDLHLLLSNEVLISQRLLMMSKNLALQKSYQLEVRLLTTHLLIIFKHSSFIFLFSFFGNYLNNFHLALWYHFNKIISSYIKFNYWKSFFIVKPTFISCFNFHV